MLARKPASGFGHVKRVLPSCNGSDIKDQTNATATQVLLNKENAMLVLLYASAPVLGNETGIRAYKACYLLSR